MVHLGTKVGEWDTLRKMSCSWLRVAVMLTAGLPGPALLGTHLHVLALPVLH